MQNFDRNCLMNRVDLVLGNLRYCNSGCDIHAVGNMRNKAGLIKELLNQERDYDPVTVSDMICRLEQEAVDFFKKKYAHIWENHDKHK